MKALVKILSLVFLTTIFMSGCENSEFTSEGDSQLLKKGKPGRQLPYELAEKPT